jgi:hypothetical protein
MEEAYDIYNPKSMIKNDMNMICLMPERKLNGTFRAVQQDGFPL